MNVWRSCPIDYVTGIHVSLYELVRFTNIYVSLYESIETILVQVFVKVTNKSVYRDYIYIRFYKLL